MFWSCVPQGVGESFFSFCLGLDVFLPMLCGCIIIAPSLLHGYLRVTVLIFSCSVLVANYPEVILSLVSGVGFISKDGP